jgi:uncharacterized membrane protein YcaP (DUF421 family)
MPDFGEILRFTMNPFELVLRGTLIYLGLVALFRGFLRRDLGELGVADVLFIALLADAAQNGMSGEYRSLADAAVLLGTLCGWNLAIDYARFHWPLAQRIFEPPAVELIRDGRVLRRNLRREWISMEELTGKLREKGISDISEVKLAALEPSGELSVLERDGGRLPTDPRGHVKGG